MNSPLERISSAQRPKPCRSKPDSIASTSSSLWARVSGAGKCSITSRVGVDRRERLAVARRASGAEPQPRSVSSCGSAANRLLVQREPDPRADRGDDPEAEHDLRLRPGHHLEVVVERRHQQDPPPEGLESEDLGGDRERLDHEDPADDDQQHLGLGHHREGADRAAEPERAGVAHEDRGREGVEPEEPDAGPDQAGGEQGQVLLLVGDEADRGVGEEDDRAAAGGEAVEPVGEVDAVRGPGDDEEDEDEVEDRAEVDAGVADPEEEGRLEADLVAGDPPEAEREEELERGACSGPRGRASGV